VGPALRTQWHTMTPPNFGRNKLLRLPQRPLHGRRENNALDSHSRRPIHAESRIMLLMSSVATLTEKSHIVCTPDIRGGKPRINGTRICVQDVYQWHELDGKSPDQIVDDFPHLTMADVYAALAFFWDHREQILEDIRRQDRLAEELIAQYPSKLAEKLRARQGNDAVSP